jgi:hypothetical protein
MPMLSPADYLGLALDVKFITSFYHQEVLV